ncbi:MAG: hypothetical protein ACOCUT_03735, partial [bacterium]
MSDDSMIPISIGSLKSYVESRSVHKVSCHVFNYTRVLCNLFDNVNYFDSFLFDSSTAFNYKHEFLDFLTNLIDMHEEDLRKIVFNAKESSKSTIDNSHDKV